MHLCMHFLYPAVLLSSPQAKRADVNCIILPKENQRDFEDLPDFIKDGIEVHYAEHYDDVYKIVFPS